jgi:hypothetical protein
MADVLQLLAPSMDLSDMMNQEILARLFVWGQAIQTLGCITANGLNVNMTAVPGEDCSDYIRRQTAIHLNAFITGIEQECLHLEYMDQEHEMHCK